MPKLTEHCLRNLEYDASVEVSAGGSRGDVRAFGERTLRLLGHIREQESEIRSLKAQLAELGVKE